VAKPKPRGEAQAYYLKIDSDYHPKPATDSLYCRGLGGFFIGCAGPSA
jgi:hypothetical protein